MYAVKATRNIAVSMGFLCIPVFVGVLFLLPSVVFAATQAGEAKTSASNGSGTRHWKVTTDTAKSNAGAESATQDETFEVDAGSPITLKMLEFGDVLGPIVADSVTFEVREENTATVADSFTWNAGSTVAFTPSEAGTYRIYIRAVNTGLGTDYDVNSDTDDNRGYLRAGTTLSFSDDANATAAYPDDVVGTVTLGHAPNMSKDITIAFRQSSSDVHTEDVSSSSSSFATTDTIDNTYDESESTVDTRITFGTSETDWTGVPWTHLTAVPSGFTQVGSGSVTSVEESGSFTADPRVYISSDGTTANNTASTTQSVYNRGETVDYSFYVLNARDEQQSDAFTVAIQDDDLIEENAQSKTGPLYSGSYVTASDDKATNDTVGSPKTFVISATGATRTSDTAYRLSRLIRVGQTEGATTGDVNTTYSVYNRGETVSGLTLYLTNVRGEAYGGQSVTIAVRDNDNTVEETQNKTSGADGLVTLSDYVIASDDKAVNDTSGSPKHIRITPADGNTVFSSNTAHSVSSLYFVDAHPETDATLSQDTFPNEDDEETNSAVIAADIFRLYAHVVNVRKDTNIDTSGSAITFTIKKPDTTTETTATSDTGSDGWTDSYEYPPIAPSGTWSVTADVSFDGNSGTDTEALTFISPLASQYITQAVGWNQTYSIGDTATFTLLTMQKDESNVFQPTAADAAPTYDIRYWDGALWQTLTSGTMSTTTTATYEATYAIPNDAAWIGRRVTVLFHSVMGGIDVGNAKEVEIVGSPAQVLIQSVSDKTVPTIAADVRITNEGTAAFEYTYEWCIVASTTNECGGGDDVAYGSAAKLIQPGSDFDTTLTLNIVDAGAYFYKLVVWWSNESSQSSRSFTATSDSSGGSGDEEEGGDEESGDGAGGSSGGGGSTTIVNVIQHTTATSTDSDGFLGTGLQCDVCTMIEDLVIRVLGLEERSDAMEERIRVLEAQVQTLMNTPRVVPASVVQQVQVETVSSPQNTQSASRNRFPVRLE